MTFQIYNFCELFCFKDEGLHDMSCSEATQAAEKTRAKKIQKAASSKQLKTADIIYLTDSGV